MMQPPAQPLPVGQFLTDSIEIGRPFRYSLTYRHPSAVDVLFPDTAKHFSPYRVQHVAVFATQTTGSGLDAISRDSAVYTLVSFETDSMQLLQVPVRLINAADCTALMSQTDTIFLRSKLTDNRIGDPQSLTLATETQLAPLQQQFNYPALGVGLFTTGLLFAIIYGVFGRAIRRQWRLYQMNRRHVRFLREYNRLSSSISPQTASETANQVVIMWKSYLEKLDRQPYASLTTSEIADRMNDDRVTNALREADRMIYGGAFSSQSQSALRVLSDVATQTYHRRQGQLQTPTSQQADMEEELGQSESPSSFS
ncbi:hypothetical protein GCM10027341_37360 [Spirosoma knui]